MEQNVFELATRKKLRFDSGKGMVSVEELWDLSLAALDKLAIALRKTLRNDDESFIGVKTVSSDVEISFGVVKHIIDVKLAERDARVMAAERAVQREKLKEIIAQKQDNALQNLSLEDLQQQLAALS